MKILAIDTSTKNLCLGIYLENKFYGFNLNTGNNLSSLLAPTIERVISAAGLKIKDIDYFGCGLGPGSFTGLRIGLATIKGLSLALDKPIVGVPSMDILAENAREKKRLIVTALDARRNLIYCSSYKYENNSLKQKSSYRLLNPQEFIKQFQKGPLILGDAALLYKNLFLERIKGAIILDKDYWILQPNHLLALTLAKIKKGKINNPSEINPIYLYPKECQIKSK